MPDRICASSLFAQFAMFFASLRCNPMICLPNGRFDSPKLARNNFNGSKYFRRQILVLCVSSKKRTLRHAVYSWGWEFSRLLSSTCFRDWRVGVLVLKLVMYSFSIFIIIETSRRSCFLAYSFASWSSCVSDYFRTSPSSPRTVQLRVVTRPILSTFPILP